VLPWLVRQDAGAFGMGEYSSSAFMLNDGGATAKESSPRRLFCGIENATGLLTPPATAAKRLLGRNEPDTPGLDALRSPQKRGRLAGVDDLAALPLGALGTDSNSAWALP